MLTSEEREREKEREREREREREKERKPEKEKLFSFSSCCLLDIYHNSIRTIRSIHTLHHKVGRSEILARTDYRKK